ncbi:hypothetical protein [Hymenobacter jeollabukensis]|uniref:Uncharacterized protein n=1 Tax=Hymenobacter jeollabukensis TaxID=2025313 RepID=A0A5R8WP69_9BACT|nr:hypothetical protein [Hymenobacter jeollabukensis]TLM91844.1 hypothetical protein FDY95_14920 [Hymenobacter jeollabukensis]
MIRILLLCFALLVSSVASTTPAEAARISAYAKAKMKGRIYTHRPSYKNYKGRKKAKRFSLRKTGKASSRSLFRSNHSTTRF